MPLTDATRNTVRLLWCGPAAIVLVLFGFCVLAGFLPPPSPALSTGEVVALWHDGTVLKQTGLSLAVWGGVLYVLFAVGVAFGLRHVEGEPACLSVAQAVMGAFGMVFFCWNFLWLAAVPFRDQPAETTRTLTDIGFLMTFAPVAPFCLQYAIIGLVILQDRSEHPVVPRWVAYVNFWVAILLVPAAFAVFFHSGPLAYDGLLSFWVAVGVFTVWFALMFVVLRRAVLGADPGRSDPQAFRSTTDELTPRIVRTTSSGSS